MPVLGLGTALSRPGQVEPAIVSATVAGYRLIDTADVYENEEAIGGALQFLITNGSLKREDLFITTKACPHKRKD
ncbi:Protein C07D8.6 [Aphelenchoides avenae]|nr:Protein C07D8.6 [Aphelenchus avenae]